jgi:lysophospholipid acyltransferase (LPLAT)-like uncharacterized protein
VLPAIAGSIGPFVIRALGSTWRVRRTGIDPHPERVAGSGRSYVIAFWHGGLLPLTYLHRNQDGIVLVSKHGDGELIARILQGLGYHVARGSTTRGGASAIRSLLAASEGKGDIGITPDGPKGPAHRVHPGCVYLAARSGRPLLPLAVACDAAWQLSSWDRFQIPKPFSRLCVASAPPIEVPPGVGPDDLAGYAAELEQRIHAAAQSAQQLLREPW